MAATLTGPGTRAIQPDPVYSNVMADSSRQGGWIADIVCPVKPVVKDYVRHSRSDHQTLLADLEETLLAPGGLPNKIGRPITSWLTSIILDRALRAEVPYVDIDNSPSPEIEPSNAARKIANGLRAVIEKLVYTLFLPASFDAAHKEPAGAPWRGTGTSIEEEIGNADVEMIKNGGVPSNAIIIPPAKWPGFWASAEVRAARGFGFDMEALARNGGLPSTVFGKRLYVPGSRTDTVPTGTFTPGMIWNDDTARLFYTSSPDGQPYMDDAPNFGKQFENQTDGTAFEAFTQDDPLVMRRMLHVWGSVRRSVPELSNVDHAFCITGI